MTTVTRTIFASMMGSLVALASSGCSCSSIGLFGDASVADSSVDTRTEDASHDTTAPDVPADTSFPDTYADASPDATPPVCGNGVTEDDEECDGHVSGMTCESLGFDGGTLACTPDCRLDTSGCGTIPGCVRYVDIENDSPDIDGRTWETALVHLQDGIDTVYSLMEDGTDCELWVADGVYWDTHTVAPDHNIELMPGVRMYGGFAGGEVLREQRDADANPTILDGYNPIVPGEVHAVHVVVGAEGALLDGFTVRGGRAILGAGDAHQGGGLRMWNVSMQVANCSFVGNTAAFGGDGEGIGGAIYVSGGTLSISDTTITGNFAGSFGGGIAVFNEGRMVAERCEFVDNHSGYAAGGVYVYRGSQTTITSSVFLANAATDSGGAIVNADGSTTGIENCLFVFNEDRNGGAALVTQRSSLSATNCTFVLNSSERAGALFVGPEGHLALTNDIAWFNTPTSLWVEPSGTFLVRYSDVEGDWPGAGNISTDPLLVDLSTGVLSLDALSPCIDSASGDDAPERDLDGNSRVDAPGTPNTGVGDPPYVDMGAYEYVP